MPDYKTIRDTLVILRDKYKADYADLAKMFIDHDDRDLEEICGSIMNDLTLTIAKIQDQINYISNHKIQD